MSNDDLTSFFSGFHSAVEVANRAQKEMDRRAPTKFCGFGFFRSASNDQVREIHLSRIFADLLDPSGTHGQGDRFLSLFLKELKSTLPEDFPPENLPDTTVHLEYPTDEGRRIDIVLKMPGDHWIGIENKPWAVEGEAQVKDYLEFLKKRKKNGGVVKAVYLSGDGSCSSESAAINVPYLKKKDEGSVEGWIEQCWRECEAERVRWFLQELRGYIRRELDTEGQTMVKDVINDTTVEFILRDKNPRLAREIEKAMPQVRHYLILEVKKRLEDKWCKENEGKVSESYDKGLLVGLWLRRKEWPEGKSDGDEDLSVVFLYDEIKVHLPPDTVDTKVDEFKRGFQDHLGETTRKFNYQGVPLIYQSYPLLPEESLTKDEIADNLACKMTSWARAVDTVTGGGGLESDAVSLWSHESSLCR